MLTLHKFNLQLLYRYQALYGLTDLLINAAVKIKHLISICFL